MTEPLSSRSIASPIGELTLVATDRGLRAVLWPDDDRLDLDTVIVGPGADPVIDAAEAQLGEYFGGERRTFDLPLDLHGTAFQVEVWRSLTRIPFGATSTYGAQADAIGRPRAVRAVGAANGRNPVSIVVPCHRIVGKDGALTGFAGGLRTKQFLLDHEVAVLARSAHPRDPAGATRNRLRCGR